MSQNGYYNKPTFMLVFDRIKEANPQIDFEPEQVRLVNFAANENGDIKRNTKGTLEGIPEMGREGTYDLTWNRPSLSEVFADVTVYVSPDAGLLFKKDLLETINKRYQFQLSTSDIYDGPLGLIRPPQEVTLNVRETCPAFTGSLTVIIGKPAVAIGMILTNSKLDNLTLPGGERGKIQGPVYLWGEDFSPLAPVLITWVAGDLIEGDKFDYLSTKIADPWSCEGSPKDFNFYGSDVYYNGPVESCPQPCNHDFTHAMIIGLDPSYCTNVSGHLILHYNQTAI